MSERDQDAPASMSRAGDAATSSAWRRWCDTSWHKTFAMTACVNGKACLLSLLSFGPIPSQRERRNH